MTLSEALLARVAEQIGRDGPDAPVRWTAKDCILYALSVGARPPEDLAFVYERYGPIVLPTMVARFAVAPLRELVAEFAKAGYQTLMFATEITVAGPLDPAGFAVCSSAVTGFRNRGKHLIATLATTGSTGQQTPSFQVRHELWVRDAAIDGADEYPALAADSSPATPAESDVRSWSSDIRREQYALFRLQEDFDGPRPPDIHIDPEYARAAGLDRPTLIGECLLGFGYRAVLDSYGGPTGPVFIRIRYRRAAYAGTQLTASLVRTDGTVTGTLTAGDDHVSDLTVSAQFPAPAGPARPAPATGGRAPQWN